VPPKKGTVVIRYVVEISLAIDIARNLFHDISFKREFRKEYAISNCKAIHITFEIDVLILRVINF
jgi:hypothetical protein